MHSSVTNGFVFIVIRVVKNSKIELFILSIKLLMIGYTLLTHYYVFHCPADYKLKLCM